MAESETSGLTNPRARVDDPVESPIDTDPFTVRAPDGEYGYLLDGAVDASAESTAPDPGDGAFDAFNETTWNFKPVSTPWHRTWQAVVAMVAVMIAVIALVVSVVLLTVHGPADEDDDLPATQTSEVPTTATTPATISAVEPPPPSLTTPPLPPPPPPSEVQRAPVYVPPARPSRKPEINVTRKPMSVSPQKPSGR